MKLNVAKITTNNVVNMTQNIQSPTPALGDESSLPVKEEKVVNTAASNGVDPIMNNIDSFFGGDDPTLASGDGPGASGSAKPDEPTTDVLLEEKGEQQKSFDGMTAEERAVHFQSLFNKAENELKNIKPEYEKYKNVAEFLNQAYEDPQVKQAFLNELAPDLVKPTDPYEALQEQLTKEFGEEFAPDDDEATRPLSKSWRYYKRVDELYKELSDKQQTKAPQSLKDLRIERERQLKDAQEQAEKDRVSILNDMKWSTSEWEEFTSWTNKLEAKHLARWYQHIRKQKKGAPNLVNQGGGGTSATLPEVFQDLKNYFG